MAFNLGHLDLGAGQLCARCRRSAGSGYPCSPGDAGRWFGRIHPCCSHAYPRPRNACSAYRHTHASPYPNRGAVADGGSVGD